jgi:hypothetical protein
MYIVWLSIQIYKEQEQINQRTYTASLY